MASRRIELAANGWLTDRVGIIRIDDGKIAEDREIDQVTALWIPSARRVDASVSLLE